jgi:DNA-binding transcriptional MerR regulator
MSKGKNGKYRDNETDHVRSQLTMKYYAQGRRVSYNPYTLCRDERIGHRFVPATMAADARTKDQRMSDWSEPPRAFTSGHVSALTGLSDRQLRDWDNRGLFQPAYAEDDRRRPYSRVYSFRDVVGLRTIALLRKQYRVPYKEVEAVGRWLSERYATPWASLRFFVADRKILFEEPESGLRYHARPPHQAALAIELRSIEHEMKEAAKKLRIRKAADVGKIGRHRYVAHNADVLAGTRIPTAAIWDFHQAGYDTAGILSQYPTLSDADIEAAIEHESKQHVKKAG